MASAWGSSWGDSWGSSWGSLVPISDQVISKICVDLRKSSVASVTITKTSASIVVRVPDHVCD